MNNKSRLRPILHGIARFINTAVYIAILVLATIGLITVCLKGKVVPYAEPNNGHLPYTKPGRFFIVPKEYDSNTIQK